MRRRTFILTTGIELDSLVYHVIINESSDHSLIGCVMFFSSTLKKSRLFE